MNAFESAVERLLSLHPDGFTNKHLVAATGLTKQTVAARLQRLVRFGYLSKDGRGRGARYVRARDAERPPVDAGNFWQWLTSEVPRIAYVRMGKIARTFPRASDVFAVLEAHRCKAYVVLDFESVDSISEDFADEVFCVWPRLFYFQVIAINMPPAMKALMNLVIERDRDD